MSVLHVEFKFVVILFTLVVYVGLANARVQVIMNGGIGKNGSTVAVRKFFKNFDPKEIFYLKKKNNSSYSSVF